MSWLFSQALGEAYLGDTCLDGEPSVLLNGTHTQQAYLSHGKTTGFSRLSRFGMMFRPLTDDLGQELLTLYRGDFRARTFQPQEKAQELQAPDLVCGNTWLASLARLDPNTSLWKTAQCSLLEDWELSLQTFPRWGSMQSGALYPLPTLVQTTKENESGYWLTPNCMDSLPPRTPEALKKQHENNRQGRSTHSTLREQVAYPPPSQMWPTPMATDWKPRGPNSKQQGLGEKVKWPTPQARDHKGSSGRSNKGQELDLPTKVKMLPTPTSSEHKYRLQEESQASKCLEAQARRGELEEGSGGTLNPTWVEWLMGWPLGWTDLKPLEMDRYQKWLEQHGGC